MALPITHSCFFCHELLSVEERYDRTKTVFWFVQDGKRFAHTLCWTVAEGQPV